MSTPTISQSGATFFRTTKDELRRINRAHAVWVVLISVLPSTISGSAALDSGHAIYNDGLEIGMPVLAIRLVLFRW